MRAWTLVNTVTDLSRLKKDIQGQPPLGSKSAAGSQ